MYSVFSFSRVEVDEDLVSGGADEAHRAVLVHFSRRHGTHTGLGNQFASCLHGDGARLSASVAEHYFALRNLGLTEEQQGSQIR